MINFNFNKSCTGCGACGDICPKQCIRFVHDKYGFIIPKVDKTLCINCNRCNRVCPVLNNSDLQLKRHVFCSYNLSSQERHHGSSGSIMLLLAKKVISSGGKVFGASFDENLVLRHQCTSSYEGLLKQSKSKYIQSDTRGVFQQVQKELKAGCFVMFVGTPCQCTALSNYVSERLRKSLLIVDFVCHGVPSQQMFNDSIHEYEKRKGCKVTDFSFREKSKGALRNYKITYTIGDRQFDEIGKKESFPYYYAFLHHFSFRNSCYECKFANISRVSDITLGDMWGIEHTADVVDFELGYSLIYTNTEQGIKWYDSIRAECNSEELCLNDKRTFNYAYSLPTHKNLWTLIFRFCYRSLSYSSAEKLLCRSYGEVTVLHKLLLLLIGKLNKYYLMINKK